jgi:hypothetical protein
VDLCGKDNTDPQRQCLVKGHTMLTKQPSQGEFEECWSEVIIKNGLSPSLVDDPLFRKALVTTARMGQSAVCVGKGTALGKRDTTLTHHHTFARKIIPATDKRLDVFFMIPATDKRLDPAHKWAGQSDGQENAQCFHEQVECFSCSHSLSCFCNGQTILSEGDGRGDLGGHLVRDVGFFEGSWGQGFQ